MKDIIVHYSAAEFKVLTNYLRDPLMASDPVSQRVLTQIREKMEKKHA